MCLLLFAFQAWERLHWKSCHCRGTQKGRGQTEPQQWRKTIQNIQGKLQKHLIQLSVGAEVGLISLVWYYYYMCVLIMVLKLYADAMLWSTKANDPMQAYVHNIIIICGLIMVLNLYAHHAMVTTVSTRQIMEQQQQKFNRKRLQKPDISVRWHFPSRSYGC